MPEIPRPLGRRRVAEAASRRPSPLTVLSVLIPLLTIAALALVRPAATPETDVAPREAALPRASLVCPAQVGGARQVVVGTSGATTGDVMVRGAGGEQALGLGPVGVRAAAEALVVTGTDDLAPGLVATRAGGGAGTACRAPEPDQWFTGVGAGAEHRSVLSLTNPDSGPAVADVTVLGADGVVDVPALRGVRVVGGQTTVLDLAEVAPSREALALQVVVSRGRLGVHVLDMVDPLGRGRVLRDWLPAQATPSTTSYLVGLGRRPGSRTLTVANPGESEVRVDLRLVDAKSEFQPAGVEEVRVRPGAVVEVDLGRVLRSKVARGTLALRLDATGPVTAGLRSVAADDLALTTATDPVADAVAVPVPTGAKHLVVAGASAPGVLTWTARDADGTVLVDDRRVEIDPGTATRLKVPSKAVLLTAELERAHAWVSVEVGPPGLGVLPLRDVELSSLVPHVQPALR